MQLVLTRLYDSEACWHSSVDDDQSILRQEQQLKRNQTESRFFAEPNKFSAATSAQIKALKHSEAKFNSIIVDNGYPRTSGESAARRTQTRLASAPPPPQVDD